MSQLFSLIFFEKSKIGNAIATKNKGEKGGSSPSMKNKILSQIRVNILISHKINSTILVILIMLLVKYSLKYIMFLKHKTHKKIPFKTKR